MTKLRELLETETAAPALQAEQAAEREALRQQNREKIDPETRAFFATVKRVFPNAKLTALRFADGTTQGSW